MRSRKTTLFASLLPVAALSGAPSPPVTFKLKQSEKPFLSTSRSSIKQRFTIDGKTFATEAETRLRTETTSTKPAADGTWRSTEKNLAYAVKLRGPGTSLDFDSEMPAPEVEEGLAAYVEALSAMKGTSYTVVVKKDKVIGVEGLDEGLGTISEDARKLAKSTLQAKDLKRNWQQSLDMLPRTPVRKGARWQRLETISLGGGQSLTFGAVYQYQGPMEKSGRKLDQIAIRYTHVNYSAEEGLFGTKVVSSKLKVQSSSGHLLFDRQLGRTYARTMKARVAGPIVLAVNGSQGEGKLELTLEGGTLR